MHGVLQDECFIQNNIFKYDNLCLLENWLYSGFLDQFNGFSNDYNNVAISSMNSEDLGNVGRPFGGLAF